MGVKGRLKDMSLVDIIQIFNAEHKTAAIHLGSELGYGRVYIKDGRIIHASYRGSSGTDAFFQLITWKDGEFEVDPNETAPEVTIHESAENLLLEGMRRMDESRAHSGDTTGYTGDIDSIRLINSLLKLGILEKQE